MGFSTGATTRMRRMRFLKAGAALADEGE